MVWIVDTVGKKQGILLLYMSSEKLPAVVGMAQESQREAPALELEEVPDGERWEKKKEASSGANGQGPAYETEETTHRDALRAAVQRAMRSVRPIVEKGRATISDEESYIIGNARLRGGAEGVTRREQYLHEYARGMRMPAFGETRRAFKKVENILKDTQKEYAAHADDALGLNDESLNDAGKDKLGSEEMLNNLDALVRAGAISPQDANTFLILHALDDTSRLKRTKAEQQVYTRVLKEVKEDQQGFEKALDKLTTKKKYSTEEREAIKTAVESGEGGLSEEVLREYVRKGYTNDARVASGESVASLIHNIVALRRVDPAVRSETEDLVSSGFISKEEAAAFMRGKANFASGKTRTFAPEERMATLKINQIKTAQRMTSALQRMGWDDADIARLGTIASAEQSLPLTYTEGQEPPKETNDDVRLWYKALKQARAAAVLQEMGY